MNDFILPINLWQVPQIEPTRNYDYISNIIENGLIQDFFVPGIAAQNPLFQQVNNFNENVGILQTATQGIDEILNYVDILKNVNPEDKNVMSDLANEINDVIKNTNYNSIPVFQDKLQVNGNNVDLSIPTFDINNTNITDYEKLLTQKQKDLFEVLNNISLELPGESNFNPNSVQTLQDILNSGELTTAYETGLINPLTFQLLLS